MSGKSVKGISPHPPISNWPSLPMYQLIPKRRKRRRKKPIYSCLGEWRNEWKRCRFPLALHFHFQIIDAAMAGPLLRRGQFCQLSTLLETALCPFFTSYLTTSCLIYFFFLHFPEKLHAYLYWKRSEGLFWQFVGDCKIFAQNNSIGFVDDWFWHFSLHWILVWAAELDWNISIWERKRMRGVLIYLDAKLWVVHQS